MNNTEAPSPAQLHTLRHMLGINTPYARMPEPSRDYYCANPGDADLVELERLGLVRKYAERDSYWWYCCTEHGKALAMASHKTIRVSNAKRMYSKFLNARDCWQDLTFREYLTQPYFAQSRAEA